MGCGASTQAQVRPYPSSSSVELADRKNHGHHVLDEAEAGAETQTQFDAAMEHFAQQQWAEALSAFQAALRYGDTRVVRCCNGIGLCYTFLDDVKSAIASFEQALQVDPENESALHNRAKLMARTEDLEQDLDIEQLDPDESVEPEAPSPEPERAAPAMDATEHHEDESVDIDAPSPEPEPATPAVDTTEQQPSGLTVRELRTTAAQMGIDEEAIENARDALDPPTELMLLINQRQLQIAQAIEAEKQAAAATKIAAVQRGKQDRARVQQLMEARAALEMQQQAAAATRIAAVQRGKHDRARVRQLMEARAALEMQQQAAARGLNNLSVRDLRQRASEIGVDCDAIEEARDAYNPQSALIGLILQAEQEASEQAQAVTKIAAVQRGKRDRARVAKLRAHHAAEVDHQALSVGQQVAYDDRANGCTLVVRVVHIDRSGGPGELPFYTIALPNNAGERQTEQGRLRVLSAAEIAAAALGDAIDDLTAELTNLSVRDLRQRASEMEVDSDAIEEARDGLDPPSALIALIVEQAERRLKAEQEAAQRAAVDAEQARPVTTNDDLTAELTNLSVRDLRQRASEMGVDSDAIEEARDGLDPPSALIALIVEHATRNPSCAVSLEGLESKLATMSVGELRSHALTAGVSGDAIEEARDGMDPVGELTALIVRHYQSEQR